MLDFLSGFGVYNIGRNHPHVADVLKEVMDEKTASIVQMDLGVMSGMLAEKLAELAPGDLEAVFLPTPVLKALKVRLNLPVRPAANISWFTATTLFTV